MSILTSKITIGILIALGILVVLYFTGKKSVHNEVIINASAEKVWKVLTDFEQYTEWNPTMQLVKGDVKKGNSVTYLFTQDKENKSEIPAKVREIVPNELLNQHGGIPFVLTYNHRYILESQGDKTKVIIHEDYRGIGVNFWNPKPVEEAYKRLNKALKLRVEEQKDL